MVFVALCPKLPVIANQCAHWCGNPPVRWKIYRQLPHRAGKLDIFGGNRYLVPWGRGIATTSVRTGLAMTAFFQTPIYPSESFSYRQYNRESPGNQPRNSDAKSPSEQNVSRRERFFDFGLDKRANIAIIVHVPRGCSSSGRAPPCQGGGSEFEPRHPLHNQAAFVFPTKAVFMR